MDKKGARKAAGKAKESRRTFRLKASPPSGRRNAKPSRSCVAAGAVGGDSRPDGIAGMEEPSSSPLSPQPTPSPPDVLLAMEQQLRAGIIPTLPASAHERAGLLASSLLQNGTCSSNGTGGAIVAAPSSLPLPSPASAAALPASRPSPHVSSFIVPIIPTLTKKRGRSSDRGGDGVFPGQIGRGRGAGGKDQGRAAAAAATSRMPFVVVKEWEFSEKKGSATIKKPPFFWELWMMMAAFGDPRGNVTCKCPARGMKACPCLEGVVAMEELVKALGLRLVEVCREWSDGKQVRITHVQMAMPGEMREYLAWKEAHSKRGTKHEAERGAELHFEGLEDASDSDDGDDDDGDVGYDKDDDGLGSAAAPKSSNEKAGGALDRDTEIGAIDGVGYGAAVSATLSAKEMQEGKEEKGGTELVLNAGASVGESSGAGKKADGIQEPWNQKLKHRKRMQSQQQQQQQSGRSGAEITDWGPEEEEVACRMEQRKRFADERTALMEEEEYINTFFVFRKAFFLSGRGGGHAASLGKKTGKTYPGSRAFFAEYVGLGSKSREASDKKLLEALAFMMYDYVGRVVEAAIRKRTGGRLVCEDPGEEEPPMLSAEEVRAAGATIPALSGRKQRESVRAFRAANPDGISHHRPLRRFPVGLEYRGQPLRWPRNMIQGGRVLVDGGEAVDGESLAAEAMALLESDFADI